MSRRLFTILIPCGVLLLAEAAFLQSNKGALLAVAVTGRSQCSVGLTMSSVDSVGEIRALTDRMRAASRLVREDGNLQLWETPRGSYWMPKSSAGMIPLVLAEQEYQIYGRGVHAVKAGDVVLDCGADIGTFTRSALNQGAKVVVSIEPSPDKEPCLRRNFEKEIAAGRVIVVPKGVWNEEGSLVLYGDSVVEKRASEGVRVPLTTIDKLVGDLKLPRVDYIKMDIEGAEKQALAGGRETILRYHPHLSIATEHLPDDAVAIPRTVRSIVPDYKLQCGPCEFADGHFRPQTIYLY